MTLHVVHRSAPGQQPETSTGMVQQVAMPGLVRAGGRARRRTGSDGRISLRRRTFGAGQCADARARSCRGAPAARQQRQLPLLDPPRDRLRGRPQVVLCRGRLPASSPGRRPPQRCPQRGADRHLSVPYDHPDRYTRTDDLATPDARSRCTVATTGGESKREYDLRLHDWHLEGARIFHVASSRFTSYPHDRALWRDCPGSRLPSTLEAPGRPQQVVQCRSLPRYARRSGESPRWSTGLPSPMGSPLGCRGADYPKMSVGDVPIELRPGRGTTWLVRKLAFGTARLPWRASSMLPITAQRRMRLMLGPPPMGSDGIWTTIDPYAFWAQRPSPAMVQLAIDAIARAADLRPAELIRAHAMVSPLPRHGPTCSPGSTTGS